MNRGFQMKRLILVLVFFLISCGGGGGSDSSSSSSSSSNASLPAGCCSIYQTAAVQSAYLAGYTGQGSTIYDLSWSNQIDTSSTNSQTHMQTTNGIIAGSGGIATYATLVPVSYNGTPNSAQWFAQISSTLAGMSSGQIINISSGVTDYTSGYSITVPTNIPNILISVSAGNTNEPTLTSTVRSSLYNSAYKSGLIIVGVLGTDGNIASYSSTAGAAADRFVVDYGTTTVMKSGWNPATSFSAPRVTGDAAIIKQKYPTATASQIATAILNTAVLKPGWDPAIYGKGQVDLTAALKYLGSN